MTVGEKLPPELASEALPAGAGFAESGTTAHAAAAAAAMHSAARERDWMQLVLFAAAVAAATASVAFFVWRMESSAYTPDFPWILGAGRHILATGSLPAGDIFSWSRSGEPWVLYQWLFEVVVAWGERTLGDRGLLALFSAAAVAIYLYGPLCSARPGRVSVSFVLQPAALGLAIASVNLSLRPMIATSAFLLLQYLLVQRLRRGEIRPRTTLLLLLPLYLLWGNMHTGVTLGLLSIALFAAGDLTERYRIYPFEPADAAIEGRPLLPAVYVLLAAAAFAASLVNPYGFGIYEYIFALSRQSYLNGLIEELQSPDFQKLRFQWFLLFIGALLFFLTRARRTLAASDLLHLLVLTVGTLHSARFVVWASLFYALVLPRALHHEWTAGSKREQGAAARRQQPGAALLWAGIAVPGALLPIAFLLVADRAVGGWCDGLRPAIAAYQDDRRPTDRLFNSPIVGSCALAQDAQQRVFIDTRFDFYGTDFVRGAMDILRLRPGWPDGLEARNIDVVIVERAWPLAQALEAGGDFAILFEDEKAVVARRKSAPSSEQASSAR